MTCKHWRHRIAKYRHVLQRLGGSGLGAMCYDISYYKRLARIFCTLVPLTFPLSEIEIKALHLLVLIVLRTSKYCSILNRSTKEAVLIPSSLLPFVELESITSTTRKSENK